MKARKIFVLIFGLPFLLTGQSLDGNGKADYQEPAEIHHSSFAAAKEVSNFKEEELPKYKKGQPVRFYQWFDYKENDTLKRYRREYDADYFMYDEWFTSQNQPGPYQSVRHLGKRIAFENMKERGNWLVAHGKAKVYDRGVLQATLIFDHGRPTRIFINHYYMSGQLHFVRDIRSTGPGQPFRNVGVLEYYRPDGSLFENPITEDGSAIVILNEEGDPEDECACMNQDIMEWGAGYLYPFLGKFYYLLEEVYKAERMNCCWE